MIKFEMMKDALEGHKIAPALYDDKGRMSVSNYRKHGYEVFSPGPIYSHTLLDRSIVQGFRDQRPGGPNKIEYSVWEFQRPVVEGCGTWTNLLCVMDTGNFQQMLHWMTSLKLIDHQRKLLHIPSPEQAAILDPFLLDQYDDKIPTAITVICPVCQKWHVRPEEWKGVKLKELAPDRVKLTRTDPPVDVALKINQTLESLKM